MFKRFRLHAILILACAVIIFYPMLREKPDTEKAEQALVAAAQFLSLVDAAEYGRSWQQGAELLKEKVSREQWIDQLTKIHALYGALIERSHRESTFTTSALDSPDGEYIILQYESSFKNKESVNETVIATLEPDGNWRVAGYHIQ